MGILLFMNLLDACVSFFDSFRVNRLEILDCKLILIMYYRGKIKFIFVTRGT